MDKSSEDYLRFLNGDDSGIVEIIKDHKDGLMLFLNRYTENISEAEELTEDTFFRLVIKKPRYKERCSFKTWLYTIGRNIAVDHLRKKQKVQNFSAEELEKLRGNEYELENSYLKEEQKIILYKALNGLKNEYAQVLHLRFFEELSNEDCAGIMGKSKRQIENMMYQAKKALRTELEKEGFIYEEL